VKFVYEFRTSDNARHEGVISAASRDAAFAALKQQGIRPGRLVEAPGLFNKLFGKGKRWMAIAVLAVLVMAALAAADRARGKAKSADMLFDDPTRRQLIGDVTVIEKGTLTGWRDVFAEEGDRFLAGFAVPGVPVAVRTTSEGAFRRSLANSVPVVAHDSIEVRQIKSIVEGLKMEIRQRLTSGWTIQEVSGALVKRQDREIAYYNQAKHEIEEAAKTSPQDELIDLWERRNADLRKMGIRQVPFPE